MTPMVLLAVGLAATLAMTSPGSADALSPEQKKAIEALVRDFILKNPEVIGEALQALQDREQKMAEDRRGSRLKTHRDQLLNDPTSPVLGNRNGDVTVVEFFDYRCPYCKRAAPVLDEVIKADGRVRRVMKEFPILGPDSVIASRAALAARAQGKYEELHRALIGARGQLDESAVMAAAKGVGLDLDRLRRDMRSTEIDGIIRRNRELAESLEITGTPAFVIGDAFLPGAADAATFRSLIQKARGG